MKRLLSAVCVLMMWGPAVEAQVCQFWVAPPPTGNDGNPGTQAQPWATADRASSQVFQLSPGGATICFRDGVYTGGNSLYERFTGPAVFRAENTYRAVLQNNSRALSLFGARNMVWEGFEIRHDGPGAAGLVVQVQQDTGTGLWAENITFRNNIFHDSWNNDILKVNNGARFVRVEGNVFYNQGPGTISGDEHIDINSVTDVVVEDNIFFNDFPGSGRPNLNDTSSFIVIKDSNDGDDGQFGSERIAVRRNVFLNWQGGTGSNFVLIGEDGKPYHEAVGVTVENNLMLGNTANTMRASFGVKGSRDIRFRNNTVAGDLPALAYALRLNLEGSNLQIRDVFFHNNIWSDPTGTMGAEAGGGTNDFSDGGAVESTNVRLDRNLYWNGGAAIPPGDVLSPLVHDARRIVADPLLQTNQAGIVVPRWTGTAFVSGSTTIRQEFERLVATYGVPAGGSPALGQADAALAPADDILGRPRPAVSDIGAWEGGVAGLAFTPTTGPAAGGERLTLSGGPFNAGATVTVGGAAAADTFVGSSTFLKATAPARPPASLHTVVVTNPGGPTLTMPVTYMSDFLDVPRAFLFHGFIERLFRRGVTSGCGGGNYCPQSAVTRQEMAVFLLRAREGGSYAPPPCTAAPFDDVPCSSPFAAWIAELVNRGVTAGCGLTTYCPQGAVTRGQMAVLLLRTLLGSSYAPPACTAPAFSDVPCSHIFASWINDLVARGITGGCAAGQYCPGLAVTRAQMAVFLGSTFGF